MKEATITAVAEVPGPTTMAEVALRIAITVGKLATFPGSAHQEEIPGVAIKATQDMASQRPASNASRKAICKTKEIP